MNRLQKKCLIATAGFHLLLLVILFVGPAFFNAKPKMDDSQVLDVIPANLVDAVVNTGVKNATPPAPAPIITPQPIPPAPKPVVQPAPAPQPTLVQRIEKVFTPEPVKPVPATTEIQPHKIQPDLTPVVRNPSKNSDSKPKPDSQAINKLIKNIQHDLSPPTEVTTPGDGGAAAANYAQVVKSIYEQAWTPPDDADNDDANARVSVTISSDGTVITARIITPSGDKGVDDTVQRTLDRVQFIAPFPSGSTDKVRTYIINFNLKAKRMLG